MTPIEQSIQQLVAQSFGPLICPAGGTPSPTQAPGGMCGVYYNGLQLFYSYGVIDEAGTPPDQDVVFGLGSVTKTLTTSILGQKADLFEQAVNNYLPSGYALTGNEVNVTFVELATFTAGIVPSDPPSSGGPITQDEFIAFINGINPPQLPAPNVYSNSSVGFLGQVLMGMDQYASFEASDATAWWTNHLLSALSMNNTGSPPITDGSHPLSDAFACTEGAYKAVKYAPWVPWGTAGRAFSTCQDMMNFVMANCGVSTINGQTVPQIILDGMANAQKDWAPPENPKSANRQGFAWVIIEPGTASQFCGKDGGITGVSAYVTVCPLSSLGVVFLTNMKGVPVQDAALRLTKALQNLSSSQNKS